MRLAGEGICFSNCYANNFRTDRGLVSVLSGWMGLPTASLMKMSEKCRRLPGLAQSLSDAGYSTCFLYGGDIDFTNMRGYLLESGFDAVTGAEGFPASRRFSSWGAPDAYTLLPTVLCSGIHPSFTAVLTLSSHEPWQVPTRILDDNRCNSFAYTDSSLGVLVNSHRSSPLWDSLLIVVIPDHGVPLNSSQSTSDPSVSHIPMVWGGGAVRHHPLPIDVLMMQSDFPATLLAQLGIGADAYPFSRNVLSPSFSSKKLFALHAFKNGCNYIDSTGISRFDCADGSIKTLSGNTNEEKIAFIYALIQYIYYKTAKL